MSTTTPAPAVRRGFNVPCLRCNETGTVQILLSDLTGVENVAHCTSCEEDFDLDDVRNVIGKWTAALKWLDSAPVLEDE